MATQIIAVNKTMAATTKTTNGTKHRHISQVKTAGGRVLSRAEVVSRIKAGTEEFCTIAGGEEARVIVVNCLLCRADDYIKTTADSTLADNLLDLPSFVA